MPGVADLERRCMLLLLLFFAQTEKAEYKATELLRRVECSHTALYASLKRLLELGLVVERWDRDPYRTRNLCLSPRGQAIAEHIAAIDRLLKGTG